MVPTWLVFSSLLDPSLLELNGGAFGSNAGGGGGGIWSHVPACLYVASIVMWLSTVVYITSFSCTLLMPVPNFQALFAPFGLNYNVPSFVHFHLFKQWAIG